MAGAYVPCAFTCYCSDGVFGSEIAKQLISAGNYQFATIDPCSKIEMLLLWLCDKFPKDKFRFEWYRCSDRFTNMCASYEIESFPIKMHLFKTVDEYFNDLYLKAALNLVGKITIFQLVLSVYGDHIYQNIYHSFYFPQKNRNIKVMNVI